VGRGTRDEGDPDGENTILMMNSPIFYIEGLAFLFEPRKQRSDAKSSQIGIALSEKSVKDHEDSEEKKRTDLFHILFFNLNKCML